MTARAASGKILIVLEQGRRHDDITSRAPELLNRRQRENVPRAAQGEHL
jgi:hypothetical protein